MAKRKEPGVAYDDGTYRITPAVIATPTRLYPVAQTTARLRRDPIWLGLSVAGVSAMAIAVYRDLLFPGEIAILVALGAGALGLGRAIGILQLDAVGHRKALIVARRPKVVALFKAIRDARLRDDWPVFAGEDNQDA
jgi:hypothetical protein